MKVESLLADGAAALAFPLSSDQLERLVHYHAELSRWMRRINLVARETSAEQLVELHFLDSLTMAPLVLGHPAQCLLDIGSGAGFPGLVLAALFPTVPVTLLEPRQKRATFLRHVVRLLALDQVQVVEERAEQFSGEKGRIYSHITGRAVADPATFLYLAEPLAAPDTEVVLFLARQQSLAALPQELQLRWCLHAQQEVELPFSRAPRFLASMRRIGSVSAVTPHSGFPPNGS